MTQTVEYFGTRKSALKAKDELGSGFDCLIERECAGIWVLKSRCLLWKNKTVETA
ncbi:hypothetical protein [Acetobacter okinawensis]|uniref:hypothetical protein n=1 Tax=Acetobacter okinawensis TaxID=1076594 RepID=UPI0015D74DB3|nr:hypothetical protein [Acetobacter okinawensis]